MNLSELSQEDLQQRCSWCHRILAEGQECFGAGTRLRPEAKHLLAEHEGRFVVMWTNDDRELIAMVPTADSEARRSGYDLFFQACSEACCQAITKASREALADRAKPPTGSRDGVR